MRPLGIFDSGLGGLSVVAEVAARLPNEPILYYADTANCPYGTRSVDEIRHLSMQASAFLLAHGAKLIVVACNTATSAAVAQLRACYTVPFVAMVPAVKPAVQRSQHRRIGVLATRATLQTATYADLVERYAQEVTICAVAEPELVALVERGELDSTYAEQVIRHSIAPMLAEGIDTLVLGCTHYPFLRAPLERIVGPSVAVIDTGAAVARQVATMLDQHRLASIEPLARPRIHFYTTGNPHTVVPIARRLLGLCGRAQDGIDMVVLAG